MKNLSFEKEEDSEFESNRFNPARSGEGESVDHHDLHLKHQFFRTFQHLCSQQPGKILNLI